jgi:CheY-like chemotaxis protein
MIIWPAVRPVAKELPPPGPTPAIKVSSASLILVDDDTAVREVTAATLREPGYAVLEAGSGGAALELLEKNGNIDLMLIDFAMPGMSGAEVARRVRTTADPVRHRLRRSGRARGCQRGAHHRQAIPG